MSGFLAASGATPAAAAPFLAATVVLGAAGVAKLRRPDDLARALAAAGLPARRWSVRVGAAAEVAVAVSAVALPGALTGALVAASYAAFAVFVGLALRRGWPLASCGCFGRPDTKPAYPHVALDAGAVVAASMWAAAGPSASGRPFFQGPLLLLVAVISGLSYLAWTAPWA